MSNENTPFLADNEYEEETQQTRNGEDQNPPANAYYKRVLRALAAVITLLSVLTFALLLLISVFLKRGSFSSTWSTDEAVKFLSIVLLINSILTLPTIFLPLPILLNIAREIAMGIVVLVFSPSLFIDGRLDNDACDRWGPRPPYGEPYKPLPPTKECLQQISVVNILMAVAGGVGIFIGALILTALVLRSIALAKTKFWKRTFAGGLNWRPSGFSSFTGFTVQFTFSLSPHGVRTVADNAEASSSGAEGRLIET